MPYESEFSQSLSAHDRAVREAAEDYKGHGFVVQENLLPEDLPAFLTEFHPDLLVTTPEGRLVVEIASQGKIRRTDYWDTLRRAVEAQPGWRLEVILPAKRMQTASDPALQDLSSEEIMAHLQAGEQLANQNLMDGALTVAWAGVEAVLRGQARRDKIRLPNYQGTAALLTLLVAEGSLERRDYDALSRLLQLRNQAAHGFRVETASRADLDTLREIATRLLNNTTRQAA